MKALISTEKLRELLVDTAVQTTISVLAGRGLHDGVDQDIFTDAAKYASEAIDRWVWE